MEMQRKIKEKRLIQTQTLKRVVGKKDNTHETSSCTQVITIDNGYSISQYSFIKRSINGEYNKSWWEHGVSKGGYHHWSSLFGGWFFFLSAGRGTKGKKLYLKNQRKGIEVTLS